MNREEYIEYVMKALYLSKFTCKIRLPVTGEEVDRHLTIDLVYGRDFTLNDYIKQIVGECWDNLNG